MLPKKSRLQYHIAYPLTILVLLTVFVVVSSNQTHTRQVLSARTAASPMPIATATPIIAADMMILVSVKFSGVGLGGNKKPKHFKRRITAYVYNNASEAVATGAGLLSYDGTNLFKGVLHLRKLAEGSYFIRLTSDNALQALVKPVFQTLRPNQINSIQTITFYQGDTNNDKVLTTNDFNAFLPCFNKIKICQPAISDFNDDGKTDITDYNLLLQSFRLMRNI